ncbi:tRNA modification GTPase GTPBP3 [Trichinella spiralis]|uniref:tRNA modification GTPase GTPBP3 n=1 Tax=Trichinella spiralis TaxID=6334 RepID=A0ABR3KES1_TRISP
MLRALATSIAKMCQSMVSSTGPILLHRVRHVRIRKGRSSYHFDLQLVCGYGFVPSSNYCHNSELPDIKICGSKRFSISHFTGTLCSDNR